MSKHAMPRQRRSGRARILFVGLLTFAFVTLFVGGATGLIGLPDDGEPAPRASVREPLTGGSPTGSTPGSPSTTDAPSDASDVSSDTGTELAGVTGATDPVTTDPTPMVTGVGPQQIKKAKRLKRSLAWLRRGLADETTFRVGTFNVLGSSHTAKIGGNRRGFASGVSRMGMAWSLITRANLDVIGFQELEEPQFSRFRALAGGRWQLYPGPTLDRGSIRNSIAWRTDVWELVEADNVGIPYFGGDIIRRPVIKLKNRESGREVWFFNTHNPASTSRHGNNAHWRRVAIGIEIQLANKLAADGTPVVFTGDYNDRAEAFCPLVGGTALEAANGGSHDGVCRPPDRMDVDWIFGSGIDFSGFTRITEGVLGRVSDHPFLYASAYIPAQPIPEERIGKAAAGKTP